jgi:hypothetical protein
MVYDFALAIQITNRALAPYEAFRAAQAAGVRVTTYEEALKWKKDQGKASQNVTAPPKAA